MPEYQRARIVAIDQPFGYREWLAYKEELLREHPVLGYEKIGESVGGRELGIFRIGSGPRNIHYNGAMHANEWITGLLLMAFLEDAANALRNEGSLRGYSLGSMLEQVTLWVMPLVNPDGAELVLHGHSSAPGYEQELLAMNHSSTSYEDWKANIRGVDLNDQFPAGWEREQARRDVAGPGPRDYTGAAPLSEPEAAALADWTLRRSPDVVIAFHSQGREIYWNYRDHEPPGGEAGAKRLAAVSGYEPVKLWDSDAGYKDWFIAQFNRPGYTVEVGWGVNPLPLASFKELYAEVADLLLEGLLL